MDLDTERTATAPRSTNPVGRAIQLPLAAAFDVPSTRLLPPTMRADEAARSERSKRRKNKMAEQPLSG